MISRPTRALRPDRAERDAAARGRARNVLNDAGAGTGKTAILVDRLVEMVAPTAGDAAASIARLSADGGIRGSDGLDAREQRRGLKAPSGHPEMVSLERRTSASGLSPRRGR